MPLEFAGNKVDVTFGEPIEIPKELCDKCRMAHDDYHEVWKQITTVIETAMKDMEQSAPPNIDQSKTRLNSPEVAAAT